MKLSVRIRGDWLAVPCKASEKVGWIGDEALRRYYKLKIGGSLRSEEKVFEVRKAKGGAILDKDDSIKDVLDDNDFVTVSKLFFSVGSVQDLRTGGRWFDHRLGQFLCKD